MSVVITIFLSVPNLTERAGDYLEDLVSALPRPCGARVEHGRLCVDLPVSDAPGVPDGTECLDALRRMLPAAHATHAAPDLLTLGEIAALLGLPPACLTDLEQENPGTFPPEAPTAAGRWHLLQVLRWVRAVGGIAVDEDLMRAARAAWKINERLFESRLRRLA